MVRETAAQYALRCDQDPHRPWIMYYAALSIWTFVRALNPSPPPPAAARALPARGVQDLYGRAGAYVARGAALEELSEKSAAGLYDGLADLLDAMRGILGEAHSELLLEAHARLKSCKDMLTRSS